MQVDRKFKEYTLFKVGLQTGLRISDIIKLKWNELRENDNQIIVYLSEQKTHKPKKIVFNGRITKLLSELREKYPNDVWVFQSESNRSQGKHWSRQYPYDFLNEYAKRVGVKTSVGTHSLRKSFGYYNYKKGVSLSLLQKIFNHTTQAITLDYLGITQDEIDDLYLNTDL